MNYYDMLVIGGGPAGMMAAIFARRNGKSPVILEKMPKAGKKLLVTGAGRCNLLNERLDASFYKPEARPLVEEVFRKSGKEKILGFFEDLGLRVFSDDTGRIFPVTQQASSVLRVLELELARLKVPVECGCGVKELRAVAGGFEARCASGAKYTGATAVICGGGKSYPALGADGDAYGLAKKTGHSITEPVPSTVPLVVKDPWCHHLQGQKLRAVVRVLDGDRILKEAAGELLFTQYGLSGTAVLDASDPVSIAINRSHQKEMTIEADLLPFLGEEELEKELGRRIGRGFPREALLEGLLPSRVAAAVLRSLETPDAKGLKELVRIVKHRKFKVQGTRGWNEAEFTAGGVPAAELDGNLGSKIVKGLSFAGEIVDVQAARGGYQLAWAWASGAVAGSVRL